MRLLVIMLETPLAFSHADTIAAVLGVDVLLVGSSDLGMEMGLPGQPKHPELEMHLRCS